MGGQSSGELDSWAMYLMDAYNVRDQVAVVNYSYTFGFYFSSVLTYTYQMTQTTVTGIL